MTISQVIEKLTELQKIYGGNMSVKNNDWDIIVDIQVQVLTLFEKRNVILKFEKKNRQCL